MVGQLFGKDKKSLDERRQEATQSVMRLKAKLAEIRRTERYMLMFSDNPEVVQKLKQDYAKLGQELDEVRKDAREKMQYLQR